MIITFFFHGTFEIYFLKKKERHNWVFEQGLNGSNNPNIVPKCTCVGAHKQPAINRQPLTLSCFVGS